MCGKNYKTVENDILERERIFCADSKMKRHYLY